MTFKVINQNWTIATKNTSHGFKAFHGWLPWSVMNNTSNMIEQHHYQQCDGSIAIILAMQFDGQTPPLATRWSSSSTNNAIKQQQHYH